MRVVLQRAAFAGMRILPKIVCVAWGMCSRTGRCWLVGNLNIGPVGAAGSICAEVR